MNVYKITTSGRKYLLTTAACLLGLMCLTGCSQDQPLKVSAEPDAAAKPLPSGELSDAYLDRISTQAAVSENDAMHGLLLLVDGKDNAKNFAQRVKLLADAGILSRNWTFVASRPITKGKLAYMVYQAAGMSGGVILSVSGPSQRYCLRELQYQKVMVETGSYYSPVSGMEFIAVLGRADVYKRTGKVPGKAGDTEDY